MANNTTLLSKVDSCRETKIFGAISPDIFQAILDSIPAICRAVLNWEPLAVWFLGEIIRQIPLSGELLNLGHLEFGRILFSEDSSDIATRRRIGRAIKSVKRCQLLSRFKAVDIQSGEMIENHGKKEYFPTTYQLKDFFIVFFEIRDLAKEQDLLSLNQKQRKITLFAIAKSICDARGYVAIPKRERKEKGEREREAGKSDSSECRKPCAHCSLKGATASEAAGANRDERITDQTIGAKIDAGMELIFGSGQDWMNTNRSLPDWVRKIHARFDIEELRLRDAMKRANNGGLRLVGGQPK